MHDRELPKGAREHDHGRETLQEMNKTFLDVVWISVIRPPSLLVLLINFTLWGVEIERLPPLYLTYHSVRASPGRNRHSLIAKCAAPISPSPAPSESSMSARGPYLPRELRSPASRLRLAAAFTYWSRNCCVCSGEDKVGCDKGPGAKLR